MATVTCSWSAWLHLGEARATPPNNQALCYSILNCQKTDGTDLKETAQELIQEDKTFFGKYN